MTPRGLKHPLHRLLRLHLLDLPRDPLPLREGACWAGNCPHRLSVCHPSSRHFLMWAVEREGSQRKRLQRRKERKQKGPSSGWGKFIFSASTGCLLRPASRTPGLAGQRARQGPDKRCSMPLHLHCWFLISDSPGSPMGARGTSAMVDASDFHIPKAASGEKDTQTAVQTPGHCQGRGSGEAAALRWDLSLLLRA